MIRALRWPEMPPPSIDKPNRAVPSTKIPKFISDQKASLAIRDECDICMYVLVTSVVRGLGEHT